MKLTNYIIILIFTFLWLNSSAQKAGLEIEWELITNLPITTFKSEAEFRLKSITENLTDKNWAIFFNMAPIAVSELDSTNNLIVEHINGDWYKLRPKIGFKLEPGQSTKLRYGNNKTITKEVLAPMGIYMVRYDENGKEMGIAALPQFKLVPFTREEQLVRGKTEGYGPFSLQRVFEENKDLKDIKKENLPPIIPTPYKYSISSGNLAVGGIEIKTNSKLKFEEKYLKQKIAEVLKAKGIKKYNNKSQAQIHLSIDKNVPFQEKEAYTLDISDKGIIIKGYDDAGVFYGIQSLLSMISSSKIVNNKVELPFISIQDKPRFGFRGLHFDVARNFKTKETIFRVLDILSHYKVNNFLFYLSEDEGWRIEIPGLPELTEIGSKRMHPKDGFEISGIFPSYGSGPFATTENTGTGFYTREDFIEILKYARDRHINIIPELNFPGHARAAMISMEKRYQYYMNKGNILKAEEYRLKDPNDKTVFLSPQYFKDNLVDISNESVYRFYEKIIDEFSKMYLEAGLKLEKIHAGGDEVAQKAWYNSERVQAWADARNVPNDFLSLQASFFKELVRRMEKKGIEVHGWEEIVINHDQGKYTPNIEFLGKKVIPYIWNNEYSYPDMGYKLANLGYEVILCNVTNLYLDLAYNNDPKDPGLLWGGFVDTKKTFSFAPLNFQNSTLINRLGNPVYHDQSKSFEKLKDEAKKNIRGVQAQMWAETIVNKEMAESYLLPKVIGFAEMAWTKERPWETESNRTKRIQDIDKDWNIFANRIGKLEYPKLAVWNNGYTFWEPPIGQIVKDDFILLNTAFPGLEIRYTTDGSKVTKSSPLYSNPIKKQDNLKLKVFPPNL